MNLKLILHKIISSFISLSILCSIVYVSINLSHIYYDEDVSGKNEALRDSNQKIDVLIIGTSHASALQPCQMWERHGISAYNTYVDGDGMKRALATLKLSLQYCHPKLVLLETEGWWIEADFYEQLGWYHHMFDTFPLTFKKIQIVNELYDDVEIRKELLFPLYRYHSRWQELTAKDFDNTFDRTMGARIRLNSTPYEQFPLVNRETVLEDYNPQYVIDIINECKRNDIPIALVCLPYVQGDEVQSRQNVMVNVAKENDVKYINLTYEEGLVDYSYDFTDAEHMNMSGGTKCCDYVCNFLKENFNLQDQRSNKEYDLIWQKNLQNYRDELDEMITDNLSWEEATNLLGMDEYDGLIYIAHPEDEYVFPEEYNEITKAINDETTIREISQGYINAIPNNLGLLMTIKKNGEVSHKITEAVLDKVPYLCAISRENGNIVTAEYIGNDISNLDLNIPDNCNYYLRIRNIHDNRIILDTAQ